MIVDKWYCMSSYLAFRYIKDKRYTFSEKITPYTLDLVKDKDKFLCKDIYDIDVNLRKILGGISPMQH